MKGFVTLKKDVIIEIADTHESDGELQTMAMTTVGSLQGTPEDYSLSYTDEDGELAGCVTTLHVKSGRCVTMTRTGNYRSELVMELGRRHNCHYTTPYGELMIGVSTQKIDSAMGENGGRLEFHYTLDFNAGLAARNELVITVKEANAGCQNS